jgi:hypothetical protein
MSTKLKPRLDTLTLSFKRPSPPSTKFSYFRKAAVLVFLSNEQREGRS